MKPSWISKVVGISALSLSLSLMPTLGSVSAQEVVTETDPITTEYDDDGFDWGWLGLLGLIGLAGLAGRGSRHDNTVRYQDPNTPRVGTDFRQ